VKWPISLGRSFKTDFILTIEAGGNLGFFYCFGKNGERAGICSWVFRISKNSLPSYNHFLSYVEEIAARLS
jgi:hypothetical protein